MQAAKLAVAGMLAQAVIGAAIVAEAGAQERLDHLLKAAEHLEQADLPDKAAEIRSLASQEIRIHGQQLLQQKLAQLGALQTEINELRQSVTQGPQIKLRLKVCEYQLSKLEETGLGLVSLRQLLTNATPTSFVDDSGKLTEFIQFLQKQGVVHMVTAPVLITTDGSAASVFVGEQLPRHSDVATTDDTPATTGNRESGECGFRCECTPKILDGQQLRLAIRVQQTETKETHPERTDVGEIPGARRSFQINTQVGIAAGQTLIIGGAAANRPGTEATGVVVLLTAEIIPIGTRDTQAACAAE